MIWVIWNTKCIPVPFFSSCYFNTKKRRTHTHAHTHTRIASRDIYYARRNIQNLMFTKLLLLYYMSWNKQKNKDHQWQQKQLKTEKRITQRKKLGQSVLEFFAKHKNDIILWNHKSLHNQEGKVSYSEHIAEQIVTEDNLLNWEGRVNILWKTP